MSEGPAAAPRRIVTGHDAAGRSVVLSDAPTPRTLDIGSAAFHEIWITDRTPVEIAADEPEPTDRPVRTPPPANGVMVRFTEMAPGAESPMHRTETVDVGIVLEGETWLLLDAFVLRTVLVPAVMHLLGDRNWWLPRGLDRALPRVAVEGAES